MGHYFLDNPRTKAKFIGCDLVQVQVSTPDENVF
jgi:hypothetical protein